MSISPAAETLDYDWLSPFDFGINPETISDFPIPPDLKRFSSEGAIMADEGFKRKLTAILSADVEGYSRLMGQDEEATIRTLPA